MATAPKRIAVEPGSDIARLLDEAAMAPVLLEKNGHRLDTVTTETENIWAGYDPKAALAGMRAAAGSWKDADPEKLKDFVYRSREEGTRPAIRP
ncbi:MAG: hypothetical protein ACYDAG_12985 [Chloroflexota bacterium]